MCNSLDFFLKISKALLLIKEGGPGFDFNWDGIEVHGYWYEVLFPLQTWKCDNFLLPVSLILIPSYDDNSGRASVINVRSLVLLLISTYVGEVSNDCSWLDLPWSCPMTYVVNILQVQDAWNVRTLPGSVGSEQRRVLLMSCNLHMQWSLLAFLEF